MADAFSRCCSKEEVLAATPMAGAIEREYLEFLEATVVGDECFMGKRLFHTAFAWKSSAFTMRWSDMPASRGQ